MGPRATLTCMTGIERLRGIPATPSSQDPRRALRWRRDQLMAAGLDELSAQRLATRSDVDIHEVLTMSEGGGWPSPLRERRTPLAQDQKHG